MKTNEQEEYFTVPDVRNKLSPFKNLIALIELELKNNDSVIYRKLIESEIKQCEENIKYLSKKRLNNTINMKYKKIPIDGYNVLNMYPVYVKDLYYGREPFKIVGVRNDQVELEGDFSGGTHAVTEKDWFKNEEVFVVKSVCEEQLKSGGCQVHNLFCCGGGEVINKHVDYWNDIVE